jgi:sugar lactone lactonase YvrE
MTRRYFGQMTCAIFASVVVACGGSGGTSSGSGGDGTSSGGALSLLAGNLGGPGNVDGSGEAARFNTPLSVCLDSSGNAYVADFNNHTVRRIDSSGNVTTVAGLAGAAGAENGAGSAARFNRPAAIAVDALGNLYVADSANNVIRSISPNGSVTTLAGTGASGSADGAATAANFNNPLGIAVDPTGVVYVADSGNQTIRRITASGTVTTLAGTVGVAGSSDGPAGTAQFQIPFGLSMSNTGNLYVADSGNSTIRVVTPQGVVSTLAGRPGLPGGGDGPAATAGFNGPRAVSSDAAGNIFVADANNNTLRKITPAGVVSTLAGAFLVPGSADGTGNAARFSGASGVASDASGNLVVADTLNHTIRRVSSAEVVTTVAGAVAVSGTSNGTGAAAQFSAPSGAVADSAGNLYVADTANHAIRKITKAAVVSTFAGTPGTSGHANGTGGAASFWSPTGIAIDTSGNLYVADRDNSVIRRIDSSGAVITLAGQVGVRGPDDGASGVARFGNPQGVAFAAATLYVADTANNLIRKITAAGDVSTLAGMAGVTGGHDGAATAATFSGPVAVAADGVGNVFVADTNNHTIRKISSDGVVSTFAGTAGIQGTADGTGPAALFRFPSGLAWDSQGNLYVADTGNYTIRKITPGGTVTTVVGIAGSNGLAAGSLPGSLVAPFGVATSSTALYVTAPNGVVAVNTLP